MSQSGSSGTAVQNTPTPVDDTDLGRAQRDAETNANPTEGATKDGDEKATPDKTPERDSRMFTQEFTIVNPKAFHETVKQVDTIDARLKALEAKKSDVPEDIEARIEKMISDKIDPFISAMNSKLDGLAQQVETRIQSFESMNIKLDGLAQQVETRIQSFDSQLAEEMKDGMKEQLNGMNSEVLAKATERVDELSEALKRCEAADEELRAGLEKAAVESSKATASVAVEAAEALQRLRVDFESRLKSNAEEADRQSESIAAGAQAAAEASNEAQQAQSAADECRGLVDALLGKEASRVAQEAKDADAAAEARNSALETKADLAALAASTASHVGALRARGDEHAAAIQGLQADVALLGADAHHHDKDEGARSDKAFNLKQRFAMELASWQEAPPPHSTAAAAAAAAAAAPGSDERGDAAVEGTSAPGLGAGADAGPGSSEGGGAAPGPADGSAPAAAPPPSMALHLMRAGMVQKVLNDAFGGMPEAPLVDPEVVAEHGQLMRAMVRKVNAQGKCLEGLVADAKWRLEQERAAREKNDGIAVQCLSCLRPAPETLPRLREALNFAGAHGSSGTAHANTFARGNSGEAFNVPAGGAPPQQQQQQQRPKSAKGRGSSQQTQQTYPQQQQQAPQVDEDDVFSALPIPEAAPSTTKGRGAATTPSKATTVGGPRPLSQGTPPGSTKGVFLAGGPGMTQRQSADPADGGGGGGGGNPQPRSESPTNFDELPREAFSADKGEGLFRRSGSNNKDNDPDGTDALWEELAKRRAGEKSNEGGTGGDPGGRPAGNENKYVRAYTNRQQELFPQRQAAVGQRGMSGGSIRPSSATSSSKNRRGGGGGGGGSGTDQRPQSAGAARKGSGLSFVDMQWKDDEERPSDAQGGWEKLV